MEHEFQSAVSRGGNFFTPEKLSINEYSVTWKKKSNIFWGSDVKTILFKNIASIEVREMLVGADITISSIGTDKIIAKSFKAAQAREIKAIIEELAKV